MRASTRLDTDSIHPPHLVAEFECSQLVSFGGQQRFLLVKVRLDRRVRFGIPKVRDI